MSIVCCFALTGWAADDAKYSASSFSVNSIINYYVGMKHLKKTTPSLFEGVECEKKLKFILENKENLIQVVAKSGAFNDIAKVTHIVDTHYDNKNTIYGYSESKPFARGLSYYDSLTGHKYLKKDENTFQEFSRKGEYLKLVPSDQPHLAQSRYVHPIVEDGFILYSKNTNGKTSFLVKPKNAPHPKGWYLKNVLVSLD